MKLLLLLTLIGLFLDRSLESADVVVFVVYWFQCSYLPFSTSQTTLGIPTWKTNLSQLANQRMEPLIPILLKTHPMFHTFPKLGLLFPVKPIHTPINPQSIQLMFNKTINQLHGDNCREKE